MAGQAVQEKMDSEMPSLQMGEGAEEVDSSVKLNLVLLWAMAPSRPLLLVETRAR